jgi:hypothetical protein
MDVSIIKPGGIDPIVVLLSDEKMGLGCDNREHWDAIIEGIE